ncbi:hypothetical protein HYDPIDRAFT_31451 [Hydnomerulius pinastri MD-312]|uniref:Uncharacterized protein n=1 Tax=Hydnomerulius pinastri MD-312 TaxID=994086 RepID=A0A0C9WC42_9AGAM|nr:hypothetical protein HYDPIDRAFT_31451 [Hydnomerulius pinastri MD-312]
MVDRPKLLFPGLGLHLKQLAQHMSNQFNLHDLTVHSPHSPNMIIFTMCTNFAQSIAFAISRLLQSMNKHDWAPLMEAYLMAQGQWCTIIEICPEPSTTPDNSSDVNAWYSDNAAATGNIHVWLAPTVHVKVSSAALASNLFSILKAEYGKPGIAAIYAEFKSLLDINIPFNAHPGPAMDKCKLTLPVSKT